MKKKSKKLSLNKQSISNLDIRMMARVHGGDGDPLDSELSRGLRESDCCEFNVTTHDKPTRFPTSCDIVDPGIPETT